MPCKMALVTVDMDRNITAAEPVISILIALSLIHILATDSCDSMAYEGRIGFEYGDQAELAALFDEAMFYRLE